MKLIWIFELQDTTRSSICASLTWLRARAQQLQVVGCCLGGRQSLSPFFFSRQEEKEKKTRTLGSMHHGGGVIESSAETENEA